MGNASPDEGSRPCSTSPVTALQWLTALTVGLGLSLGVWWGLANGGGLVGGDTYPYFIPQKIVLAESFAAGEIPLWHNLTGLGYPLHAESQAGVFYPTNQVLYRLFDINTAYNVSIMLHYWLAFVFAWRFARAEGISTWPAMFAALVFIYGWFPARVSLEWSIIGGLWFPLTLWLTRELIDNPSRRRFALLAACLGTHLLAGHFTLAFINQLTIVLYAGLRTVLRPSATDLITASKWRGVILTVSAVLVGIGFAAVQLAPTYELKRISQREGGNKAFDVAYGHMPPLYATQVVASWWYWHSPEVRASRQILRSPLAINADTNAVEAHLYWGLVPLCLILCTFHRRIRDQLDSVSVRLWGILGVFGLVYATGWLLPVTRHLPGFGFFMGPGRYTIISALGGALLAGMVLDRLCKRASVLRMAAVVIALATITLPDLLWSSRHIADAVVVAESPVSKLSKSWIRKQLAGKVSETRLLAPGPNVGNLFGTSCIPQYLGLGPSIYYDDILRPATGPLSPNDVFPDDDTLRQLESLGITHILTTEPVSQPSDGVELTAQFPDALLNSVWGRGGQPCFLYRVLFEPKRIVASPASSLTGFKMLKATAHVVEFSADLTTDADVVLRELMFPGWKVSIDGRPAAAEFNEISMRTTHVESGQHTIRWTYEPRSFRIGAAVSLAFGILLTWLLLMPGGVTAKTRVLVDPSKRG